MGGRIGVLVGFGGFMGVDIGGLRGLWGRIGVLIGFLGVPLINGGSGRGIG